MKKIDSFIGSTFPTPKGGVLTVVGVEQKIKGKPLKYLTTCSICSQDEELFPDLFSITKNHLNSGRVPCGCAVCVQWSERQYTLRCKRLCIELGYDFKGFAEKFKGGETKLKLHNKATGNTWSSTIITSFLMGRKDPAENNLRFAEKMRLPDEKHIKDFIKAGFSTKDIFTKLPEVKGKSFWLFTCHKCREDVYTISHLCSGSFKSSGPSLKSGKKPCRCSMRYFWTKEQREYQINAVCSEEGLTFLGWVKENHKGDGKFKWSCSHGHLCESTVNGFVNGGKRCITCRNLEARFNGYYPERVDEKDFLYLMDFLVSTKVGRSFDIEERRKALKTKAKLLHKPEVVQSYTATHQVVYDTEQAIHTELRERGFQYECDWTTECFTKDCWYVLQEILEDYVSSGILERVT